MIEGYYSREDMSAGLLSNGKRTSPKTIRRYEQEVDGLPYVKVGRVKMYRKAAVHAWLERRERRPNPR